MKKFIFTVPYQTELKQMVYDSGVVKALHYEKATAFPIIAAIAGAVAQGDSIEILAICADYEPAKANYQLFLKEIEELSTASVGFAFNVKVIDTPYSESLERHFNLFGSLIESIEDGDSLTVDITYGSKPVPIIEFMALNYGYRLKSNVIVDRIVYSNVDFLTRKASIYDISALFYMNSTVNGFAELGIENPLSKLKSIIGGDESDG